MGRVVTAYHAFNRGLISALGLARTDIEKIKFSAETFTNFIPRVLGSMMLRPGTEYIGATASNNQAYIIPFVFSTDDTALLEFTDSLLRVWVNDALVTRSSVSSAITNGTFDSNVTNWTDDDDSGATSAWVTGGYMGLTGDGTNYAKRYQQVTVAAGDQGTEHALRVIIERGPVRFRVGTSAGDDSYINEAYLGEGYHSLTFTPTGNFFIEFASATKRQMLVDSVAVEASGTMTITAPYAEADLTKIRYDQSADVVYLACDGYQQYKIERRSTTSWSIVKYLPLDGPFRLLNTTKTTITPSALSGNTTLTASTEIFKSTNVGSLYRVTSNGQKVSSALSAENTWTNVIKVTGIEANRIFVFTIANRVDSTITLQRSFDSEVGPWTDTTPTYTADRDANYDDGLDNQEVWYRAGIATGDYGTDTVTITLDYPIGSIDGVCRVTGFTNATTVSVEVIEDFGGTDATTDWNEGKWSDRRGWPSSVTLYEGRLWWSGKNGVWGSVSDAYESFDDLVDGDSGPLDRTIGSGPVDTINWLLGLQRLILGSEGIEYACKSSSLDEPLTPSNFSIKSISSQGSKNVNPVQMDKGGLYVQRGGTRLFGLDFDTVDYEYGSTDLTKLVPEVCDQGITKLTIQRQPDTRIHCVLGDGTVALLVFDKAENVISWQKVTTDGTIENAVTLPGSGVEDDVYYVVNRTINGSTVRYLEKWALESECQGGTTNKQADSFYVYSGASTTTISGLSHLEGESVIVWGDGADQGTATVSSGAITLSTAVSDAVVGLTYTAQWKSNKLGHTSGDVSFLTQRKQIDYLGVILRNTHYQGLKYGPDFSNLDNLPLIKAGTTIADDTVHATYDEEGFEFMGNWDSDSRLCLQAQAPRPCTILAAVISFDVSGKV